MREFNDYEEDYDEDYEKDNSLVTIFDFISKWFIRIGLVIGIILLIILLFSGKIMNALILIIGLCVAFILGFGFMFLLDYFVSAE